jgi:hypothetical protein
MRAVSPSVRPNGHASARLKGPSERRSGRGESAYVESRAAPRARAGRTGPRRVRHRSAGRPGHRLAHPHPRLRPGPAVNDARTPCCGAAHHDRADGRTLGASRRRAPHRGVQRGRAATGGRLAGELCLDVQVLGFLGLEVAETVTAQWITTDQFVWAVNALLDGVAARS